MTTQDVDFVKLMSDIENKYLNSKEDFRGWMTRWVRNNTNIDESTLIDPSHDVYTDMLDVVFEFNSELLHRITQHHHKVTSVDQPSLGGDSD